MPAPILVELAAAAQGLLWRGIPKSPPSRNLLRQGIIPVKPLDSLLVRGFYGKSRGKFFRHSESFLHGIIILFLFPRKVLF